MTDHRPDGGKYLGIVIHIHFGGSGFLFFSISGDPNLPMAPSTWSVVIRYQLAVGVGLNQWLSLLLSVMIVVLWALPEKILFSPFRELETKHVVCIAIIII
jgi:hypothetical protein